MKKILTFLTIILFFRIAYAQQTFITDKDRLTIIVNKKVLTYDWMIDPKLNPDIIEIECKEPISKVSISDGNDTLNINLQLNQNIDLLVINKKRDTANMKIVGVVPNTNFTTAYIAKYQHKTFVEIPEISELVNIIMVLHKDATKESNMFDIKTDYYQRVKKHFEPFIDHPAIDTIQKYITGLKLIEQHNISIFSQESYGYYYALKMNACNYEFDKQNKIVNKGYIKEMAKGWYSFDPMKDLKIFEDFALQSNFRQFFANNKPYYDSLIKTYNQLNPIQTMQNWLDEKFGFSYGSYVVYFSPLIGGAHSTKGFEENNFKQTFMFICSAVHDSTYNQVMNELIASRIVFTEIDHNYVNPVSDNYITAINKSFSNRSKWALGEVTNAYENEYMVFNEYMTFAVYTLFLYDHYSEKDLNDYLPLLENQMEQIRGFINFKAFNRRLLAHYKENRNISIEDLYASILNWALQYNEQQ